MAEAYKKYHLKLLVKKSKRRLLCDYVTEEVLLEIKFCIDLDGVTFIDCPRADKCMPTIDIVFPDTTTNAVSTNASREADAPRVNHYIKYLLKVL